MALVEANDKASYLSLPSILMLKLCVLCFYYSAKAAAFMFTTGAMG